MSVVTVALFAAGLFASAAFAEVSNESIPANANDLARICESARLTDLERRECRAMFKAANDDGARLTAYRTFDERINGPSR